MCGITHTLANVLVKTKSPEICGLNILILTNKYTDHSLHLVLLYHMITAAILSHGLSLSFLTRGRQPSTLKEQFRPLFLPLCYV